MTNMYPRYLDVFKSRYVLWKESLGNSWNIFTRIQNILRSPIRSWVTKENSTMLLVNTVYASLSTSSRRCIFQKPKGNTKKQNLKKTFLNYRNSDQFGWYLFVSKMYSIDEWRIKIERQKMKSRDQNGGRRKPRFCKNKLSFFWFFDTTVVDQETTSSTVWPDLAKNYKILLIR